MRIFGNIISTIGSICYWVLMFVGFVLSLGIVDEIAGFWGVVIGIAVLPITFAVAPWYLLIHKGEWYAVVTIYGGLIFAIILTSIGERISGRRGASI